MGVMQAEPSQLGRLLLDVKVGRGPPGALRTPRQLPSARHGCCNQLPLHQTLSSCPDPGLELPTASWRSALQRRRPRGMCWPQDHGARGKPSVGLGGPILVTAACVPALPLGEVLRSRPSSVSGDLSHLCWAPPCTNQGTFLGGGLWGPFM